ncbi:hypothetical protein MJO28_003467 [Puccinia striiformis f. sp. tritici]|uniref:Uncharacterized protein n=1 Tax=Puccinia striiformis f. sp. tritici TaxID=168172 RepID=A0ACC0EUH8_9BASI|nr:hypothetical protein MJO28_003467 [Puccinia striiformis f. sp. tritici]
MLVLSMERGFTSHICSTGGDVYSLEHDWHCPSLVSSAAHKTSHDVPFGDQATDDELGPDTDS